MEDSDVDEPKMQAQKPLPATGGASGEVQTVLERPAPASSWVEMLEKAFAGARKELGPQRRDFVLRSACAGTGAAALSLKARVCLCV